MNTNVLRHLGAPLGANLNPVAAVATPSPGVNNVTNNQVATN